MAAKIKPVADETNVSVTTLPETPTESLLEMLTTEHGETAETDSAVTVEPETIELVITTPQKKTVTTAFTPTMKDVDPSHLPFLTKLIAMMLAGEISKSEAFRRIVSLGYNYYRTAAICGVRPQFVSNVMGRNLKKDM